jgi:hypothetical protein
MAAAAAGGPGRRTRLTWLRNAGGRTGEESQPVFFESAKGETAIESNKRTVTDRDREK